MYLNFVVLKALSEGQKSGYDLMKYLDEHSGWKVSPGSIYPLLNSLLLHGDVTQKISGRKKFYSITPKGKITLLESKKLKEKMINEAKSNIKVMSDLCGFKDADLMSDMISRFGNSDKPFGDLTFDMMNLRETLFKVVLDKQKLIKNKIKIRKILIDSTTKLSKIK